MHEIEWTRLGNRTHRFHTNHLSNRKQYTKLNTKSTTQAIKTGVPQGSTLRLQLFLIFINDLPLVSNEASFTLFADDAALTIHNQDIARAVTEAEMILERVSIWCCEKKLPLKGNTTEYVIYGSKARKVRAQPIQLSMGGQVLHEMNSYNYLGSTLDATLNGTQQLARLNQSLALKMKTFRKVRCYISENSYTSQ